MSGALPTSTGAQGCACVPHAVDTFWGSSAPGKQMLDQLYNHPFDKDKGNPRALSKDRFANGYALALAAHCVLSMNTTHAPEVVRV